jgi:CubicO group peptidase (beta-lactamase class C family)
MLKKNLYPFALLLCCAMLFLCCGNDNIVEPEPEPEVPIVVEPEPSAEIPEDIEGQPTKDYLMGVTKEMCTTRKVPVIQVAFRTPERYFAFESAQFDFVEASADQSTMFQAASVSKVVFSYIVMRLVDRGVIDLDTPLYTYTDGVLEDRFLNAFPDDAARNTQNEEWAKMLTARIVLSHGTGLPNWMANGGPSSSKLIFTYEPNTHYIYSGEAIHYLQRVVEHITGKTLDVLAEQEVFDPLGMTSTSYKWEEEYAEKAAYGYNANNEKGSQASSMPVNAAYSMRTNVHDFSKFLEAVMEGKGLSRSIWQEFTTPNRYVGSSDDYFGLGIHVRTNTDNDFGPCWNHSGSNTNFRCKFWLFPKTGTYLIYFTNSANGAGDTAKNVFQIFLPDYPQHNA